MRSIRCRCLSESGLQECDYYIKIKHDKKVIAQFKTYRLEEARGYGLRYRDNAFIKNDTLRFYVCQFYLYQIDLPLDGKFHSVNDMKVRKYATTHSPRSEPFTDTLFFNNGQFMKVKELGLDSVEDVFENY